MGKGGQVPRCPNRTLCRNDGKHIGIEKSDERIERRGGYPGGTLGKGGDLEEENEPHDLLWQRLADARRMRAHDIDLEF